MSERKRTCTPTHAEVLRSVISSAYSASTQRFVSASSALRRSPGACRVRTSSSARRSSVLALDLLERTLCAFWASASADASRVRGLEGPTRCRQGARDLHSRAAARRRLDLKALHQPARSKDAETHAGRGHVASVEDRLHVADARPVVTHPNNEGLHAGGLLLDREPYATASRVLVRVPGELRHRGRDSRLFLSVEPQELRDLARALPREHDVVLVLEL